MVRIAVSTMFFHEYPMDEGFDAVERAGLDSIEFWVETPHFWLNGHPVGELEACLRDHPGFAPVNVHSPILDLNPCSINPRVAQATLAYAAEAIELAERIGAGVVTMHPGRRTAKRGFGMFPWGKQRIPSPTRIPATGDGRPTNEPGVARTLKRASR